MRSLYGRTATIPRVEGKLFETEEPASAPDAGDVATQPLAARMRPASLGEFVGQEHLLGRGSALRTAIEEGRPHSMILYGPPGTGKTTLARLLAVNSRAAFEEASAVNAGRAEVRAVLERAQHRAPPTAQKGGEPILSFSTKTTPQKRGKGGPRGGGGGGGWGWRGPRPPR